MTFVGDTGIQKSIVAVYLISEFLGTYQKGKLIQVRNQ